MKAATIQSNESYGLGLATYYLSCGTFYGHRGVVSGTQTIAIVTDDGTTGVAIAINVRSDVDRNLLGVAESLVCGDVRAGRGPGSS